MPDTADEDCDMDVNGIRARQAQLQEFIEREQTDVLCLQETKRHRSAALWLCEIEGYGVTGTAGGKGYSGVSLHVRKSFQTDRPAFGHPEFDYESRIVTARLPELTVASIYVPNGGKDFPAKMRFLESLAVMAEQFQTSGELIVLCGDLNVALTDMDVHPKERKPNIIGQRPDERALLERVISHGLVDVHRMIEPDNASCSLGGRHGGTCASETSAGAWTSCSRAARLPIGTRVRRPAGVRIERPRAVIAVFSDRRSTIDDGRGRWTMDDGDGRGYFLRSSSTPLHRFDRRSRISTDARSVVSTLGSGAFGTEVLVVLDAFVVASATCRKTCR